MQTALRYGKVGLTWSVVVSTIAWTVGIAALLTPLSAVNAIASGDLIKASQPAVYYYGADGKRYVFPNEKTYKTWYSDFSGVKVISDTELASYPIGGNVTYRPGVKMVKITTDPKVYAVSKNGTLRWVESEALASALYGSTWNKEIHDVPDPFFVNYTVGTSISAASQYDKAAETAASPNINDDKNLTAGGPTGGGSLSVSLASDTPASTLAVESAARLPMTKVVLTNNTALDAVVDQVVVERTGLASDSSITDLDLLDAATDAPLNINSKTLGSEHMATFNDDFTVKANSSMSVIIAANMAASNDARAGEQIVMALKSITLKGGGTVSGTLPVSGNPHTVNATLAIATVTVAAGGNNPSATTQNVGTKDYIVTSFKITNQSSTEDITLKQVTLTQNGSAGPEDVENVELVDSNTSEVLSTINPTGKSFTMSFGNRLLEKGKNKTFDLRLDIKSGSSRTISLDIDKQADLAVVGKTNGYKSLPTYPNTSQPYFNSADTTIGNGELRMEGLAVTPVNISEGLDQVTLGKFKFVAKGEGMQITRLGWRFNIATSAAATTVADITNVTIYDSTGKAVAGPVSIGTVGAGGTTLDGTATTTDTVSIGVGEHEFTVKADLNTDFTVNDTIQLSMEPGASTVKGDITGNTITPTPTNITSSTLTVKGASLDVRIGTTPSAQTVINGVQNIEVANIVLDASNSGSDIRVTTFPVSITNTGAQFPNNITGIKLFDGATQVPVSTESTVCGATSCATAGDDATTTFTITAGVLKVGKGTQKTIKVTATIGTGATSGSVAIGQNGGLTGIDEDGNSVTATDAGQSTATKQGPIFTVAAAGTLNVSTLPSPASASVVGGSTVTIGTFDVQAKNEGMSLNSFSFVIEHPDGGIGSGGAGLGDTTQYKQVQSLSLYEGATLLGSSILSSANATITPSSAVSVANNQTKTFTLKATLNPVGPNQAGIAGLGFSSYLTNVDASGTSAGSSVSSLTRNGFGAHSATSTNFKTFHVFKSLPTVTQINTTNVLIDGVNTVKKFKVAADAAGPIGLWKFTFAVSTTNFSLIPTGWYLYESDSESSLGNLIAQNGTGAATIEGSNPYGGDFNVKAQSSATYAVVEAFFDVSNDDTDPRAGEHVIVNAGGTKYFTLQGTTHAVDDIDATLGNENVSVAFISDSAAGSTAQTRAQGGFGGSNLGSDIKFIWSDLNLDQYASSLATNAEMWFAGYRVPGLDNGTGTPDVTADQ